MTAYYNEIDEYAAEWLRNLIDAGHIAPGVVGNGVQALIHSLRSEGLVYVIDWTRRSRQIAPVFAWQPSVCAYVDAPKPEWKRRSRSGSAT